MNEQYQFSAGQDDNTIQNKRYTSLKTAHGKQIVIGLEHSGIPFSARFTESDMFLTYDGNYEDSVKEITKKAESGEYSELLLEIKNHVDESGYLVLLPTVAYFLHISESELNRKPKSYLIMLCKVVFQLWFCDTAAIQKELAKEFVVNDYETVFNREKLNASADRIRQQNHAFHDNQERKLRHDRK